MRRNTYLREKNSEKMVNRIGDKPLQSMDKHYFRGEKKGEVTARIYVLAMTSFLFIY